jgi:hypothetical protein
MHQDEEVIKDTIDNWPFQSLRFDTSKLIFSQNRDGFFAIWQVEDPWQQNLKKYFIQYRNFIIALVHPHEEESLK